MKVKLVVVDLNKDKEINVEIMESADAYTYKITWERQHGHREDVAIEIQDLKKPL